MEHPAGWELPWSAGRPREDVFSSGEIFDELVFGELQPGLLVDEPGSGFRFDEPPAEQLLQGPPEELPSPARSEPGTPPPSPVRPASLSDSPAEASRRKRRRDEEGAIVDAVSQYSNVAVDAVFAAATSRPLTVDEVATLLTAPPESLKLASRPEAGTQPWALHVECSREPRKFGRQTVCYAQPHLISSCSVLTRSHAQDQWRNSGGRKGATILRPSNPCLPTITRRYGIVRCRTQGTTLRFHEYALPSVTMRLFHTMPPRKRKGVRRGEGGGIQKRK